MNTGRGGKRDGAGGKKPRLPSSERRKHINIVVDQSTAQWLKEQAQERRIGQGRVVDELVNQQKGGRT